MTVPYTNPYVAQMFLHELNVGNSDGIIYLTPDSDAYSIGPDLSQTGTSLQWQSPATTSTLSNISNAHIIKDENDVFYFIVAYIASGNLRLRINVYDAENDVNDVYVMTVPGDLSTLRTNTGGVGSWVWFIRKVNSTTVDFFVRGQDNGTGVMYYQHYTWTIGDTTMTLAGSHSWNQSAAPTYGESLCIILHGPLILDLSFAGSTYYLHTYDLDSDSPADGTIFSRTGHSATYFVTAHGGTHVHFLAFYADIISTQLCGLNTVRTQMDLSYSCVSYDLNGDTTSDGNLIDTVTGHNPWFANITSTFGSAGFPTSGIDPSDGSVYFHFGYDKAFGGTVCVSGPATGQTIDGVWKHNVNISGWVGSPSTTSRSPVGGPGGNGGIRFPYKHDLPGRSDPASYSFHPDPSNTTAIVHWPDETETGSGAFYHKDGAGVSYGEETDNSGQRNDNGDPLIATLDKVGSNYYQLWKDLSGNIYLTQSITVIDEDQWPAMGMMGKWPVRLNYNTKRWIIYGPNTPVEISGARWQVV